MVSIPKRSVWGKNETQIIEPSQVLQDNGYAPLEQPYNEHHNWIWNSRDKGANTLIHAHNFTRKYANGIGINDQTAQNFLAWDAAHPYSASNSQNLPYGSQPTCICPGWNFYDNRAGVWVGFQDDTREAWLVTQDTQGFVSGLPFLLEFNEISEYCEALVCEGDALYVMTMGHSSGDVYFYRFSINPYSATPIWSTSDSGSFFKNQGRSCLCIAGDWIGYIRTNVALSGGAGTEFLRLIRKSDAGAFRQGHGNTNSLASTYYPGWSMVANGDSIFYGVYDPTNSAYVHLGGADIDNLNVANYPGGLWFSHQIEGTAPGGVVRIGAGDLVHDGQLVHISTTNGLIASYNWDTDSWQSLNTAQWQCANAKEDHDRQEHASMCYDGFNAWILVEHNGAFSSNNAFVSRAPVSQNSIDDPSGNLPFQLKPPFAPEMMLGPPKPSGPVTSLTKIAYADEALWVLPYISATPTTGTNFIRIPYVDGRR